VSRTYALLWKGAPMENNDQTFSVTVEEQPIRVTIEERQPLQVVVTDFDMPLGSVVFLAIKIAVAVIPAAIILGLIFKLWDFAYRVATSGVR